MTDLRMRVVEAGARVLAGRSEDAWRRSTEKSKTQYRYRVEAVLDAALDCLTENADEWVLVHGERNDMLRDHVRDLLAVLREPTDG